MKNRSFTFYDTDKFKFSKINAPKDDVWKLFVWFGYVRWSLKIKTLNTWIQMMSTNCVFMYGR